VKKVVVLVTALTLALSLSACGGSTDPKKADYDKCVTAAQQSGHKASEYKPVCELATGYKP